MQSFADPRHRGHDPDAEVWAGVPGPATGVPARAEAIATALAADPAFGTSFRGGTYESGVWR